MKPVFVGSAGRGRSKRTVYVDETGEVQIEDADMGMGFSASEAKRVGSLLIKAAEIASAMRRKKR
mgnify:CR=1 FL=1